MVRYVHLAHPIVEFSAIPSRGGQALNVLTMCTFRLRQDFGADKLLSARILLESRSNAQIFGIFYICKKMPEIRHFFNHEEV